jgi:hypothetical protein
VAVRRAPGIKAIGLNGFDKRLVERQGRARLWVGGNHRSDRKPDDHHRRDDSKGLHGRRLARSAWTVIVNAELPAPSVWRTGALVCCRCQNDEGSGRQAKLDTWRELNGSGG